MYSYIYDAVSAKCKYNVKILFLHGYSQIFRGKIIYTYIYVFDDIRSNATYYKLQHSAENNETCYITRNIARRSLTGIEYWPF